MTLRDHAYFLAGIPFLALAKAKSMLHGYSTPRPASLKDIRANILADQENATWLSYRLIKYLDDIWPSEGKNFLEIGPGQSLGVADFFLSHKAASYIAYDKFFLVDPDELMCFRRKHSGFGYIAHSEFDFQVLPSKHFDYILSMAAFEHFDDPCETIAQMSKVAAPGCVLCIDVDFRTHGRWIRQKDPNNIYRYPKWLYKLFSFPGQPNRVRPGELVRALEANGWENVTVYASDTRYTHDSLHSAFPEPMSEMHLLSATICARWP